MPAVRYLVFDVESVADAELVARQRYTGQSLSPVEALSRYRRELADRYDSDFVPYTYQIPVAVVVVKVGVDFRLMDLAVLDQPALRPHVMTEQFWRGWAKYKRPTLVSFHGRSFDLPVLELAAFRYGLSVPAWFQAGKKSFGQARNRFNVEAHIDLEEFLTNFGGTRFTGGLNLAANLLGKPGKTDGQGQRVQDLYLAGKLKEISELSRWDALDTYFTFLRTRVLLGQLSLPHERTLVEQAKNWTEQKVEQDASYKLYLDHWGDWPNPWGSGVPPAVKVPSEKRPTAAPRAQV